MPRKKLIRTHEYPYHITSRSNHRTWFQLPLEVVWEICHEAFRLAWKKYPVNVHLFVLMNNHYHLVIDTPNSDIDLFMYEFNKYISLRLRIETNLVNRMFGGRYKWSLVSSRPYYYQVLKYVCLNPNKAGIVQDCSTYKFSTLYYLLQGLEFAVPLRPFIDLRDGELVEWFNQSHTFDQQRSIQDGLRRAHFRFCRSQGSRRPPVFTPAPGR